MTLQAKFIPEGMTLLNDYYKDGQKMYSFETQKNLGRLVVKYDTYELTYTFFLLYGKIHCLYESSHPLMGKDHIMNREQLRFVVASSDPEDPRYELGLKLDELRKEGYL